MWSFSNNEELIQHLIGRGCLKTPQIVEAFRKVDRINFVPQSHKDEAYIDAPLPIGSGQTISQPFTVAFMLELLSPRKGDKILDIGAGSGWVSALLSEIVGSRGHIYAYEIVPSVGKFGRKNLKRFGCKNVDYVIGDFYDYFQDHTPYDGIISGAAFNKIPQILTDALKNGGIIVVPTQAGDIRRIIKEDENVKEEVYYGFSFVPITGKVATSI